MVRRAPEDDPARRGVPVRLGIIYLLSVTSADAVTDRRAYVGQTRQRLAVRVSGHRRDQPWGDLEISARVLLRVPVFLLTPVEILMIKLLRPSFNVDWNERNPLRVSRRKTLAARATRDRARTPAVALLHGVANGPAESQAPASPGLKLSEAVGLLGPMSTLDALRRASTRPGFPRPVGQSGVSKLYALEDLRNWQRGLRVSR